MSQQVGEGMMNIVAESGKRFGAEKGAGGSGAEEGGMTDLYKVNQIWYRMLPSLSLVSKRTLLVNQAQNSSYNGGASSNIVINFNTGEYYISPTTSYLYIQCGYNSPARYGASKALISQGNIMTIFREVAFTTASGTEVDRQQDKNLHSATFYRWQYPQEYINTLGQVQGAATGPYSQLYDGVAPVQYKKLALDLTNLIATNPLLGVEGQVLPRSGAVSVSQFGYGATNLNVYSSSITADTGVLAPDTLSLQLPEFCVPLDQVLGVFKPYLNTLFPAGALSGGRLELTLANMTEALQFIAGAQAGALPTDGKAAVGDTNLANLVADANSGFNITNVYLVLDAFQLQDNVLKRLNQVSAGQDGLTYLYDTYDSTKTQQQNTGSVEVQVQQARSRIVRSVCVVRPEAYLTNPYINSYASEAAVQRVCGKILPGSMSCTAYNSTALNENKNPSGCSGGLTVVQVLATTTTVAAAAIEDLLGDGSITAPLILQPRLPDDPAPIKAIIPYGAETVNSYQAQLGALFFPQQPITNVAEHYQNAQYVMCKGIPDREINSSVTFEDFKGGLGNYLIGTGLTGGNNTPTGAPVDPTGIKAVSNWVAPYGCAIYGFLAEKSQLLNLSGLPISNARLLRHRFNFASAAVGSARAIHCFTQFTRVMKTFLGGRVVVRE